VLLQVIQKLTFSLGFKHHYSLTLSATLGHSFLKIAENFSLGNGLKDNSCFGLHFCHKVRMSKEHIKQFSFEFSLLLKRMAFDLHLFAEHAIQNRYEG
jgi:hypothetical protein